MKTVTIRFENEVITSADMYLIHAAMQRAKQSGLVVMFDTDEQLDVFNSWYRLRHDGLSWEQYCAVYGQQLPTITSPETETEEAIQNAYNLGKEAFKNWGDSSNPYPTPLIRGTRTYLWSAWNSGFIEA
jgi:hypothetical protein